MNLASIFITIGALEERAPAGPFCFKPQWLLGRRQIETSRLDRALGALRGGGIENVPMWRGSERHISCGVFRASIGHLVEDEIS
jgi:hypothetical protein